MKQDLEVKNRVKEILKIVQQIAPGNSVELRIPPYAAIHLFLVQLIEEAHHPMW